MTQDEIIDRDEVLKMARDLAEEFGCRMCDENGDTHGEELYAMDVNDIIDIIERVAVKEREACAKLCDKEVEEWKYDADVVDVAIAIRARGQT